MVVIGDHITAASIHARSATAYIDWRTDYDSLDYSLIEPPPDVVDGVRRLMTSMGLVYGSLDFVVHPDGAWTFLKINAGNLVHLRRSTDRLEGRFTARWAAFMTMRHAENPPRVNQADRASGSEQSRSTNTPGKPWNDVPIVWFLAQLRLPPGTTFGYELAPDTLQPTCSTLSAPDGSWAKVGLTDSTVTEAGATGLWEAVEWAHDQWTAAGSPTWERLGLTVTRDGRHRLWLDQPDSSTHWNLPDVPVAP